MSGLYRTLVCSAVSAGRTQQQTTGPIVDQCFLTKFKGGLQSLHGAGDDAVGWLVNMATSAFAE